MVLGVLARSASTESYPAPRVDLETADLTVNPDYRHLLERFDLLGRHMQELQTYCSQFVPREEVHEAMKAVVTEVKALKKNSVTHSIFREGLKMKADTVEVDRYVCMHAWLYACKAVCVSTEMRLDRGMRY